MWVKFVQNSDGGMEHGSEKRRVGITCLNLVIEIAKENRNGDVKFVILER